MEKRKFKTENYKEYQKEYREKNRERLDKYFEDNKEKIKEKSKQYYLKNRDKIKERIKVCHCSCCNIDYKETNKRAHLNTNKQTLNSQIENLKKNNDNGDIVG